MKTLLRIAIMGLFIFFFFPSSAQNIDSLTAVKSEKEAMLSELKANVSALEGEVAALKEQLKVYPFWTTGISGLIGADVNSFNNWATRGKNLNSTAVNIGISLDVFADKTGEKYFWRNNGSLVLGWQKFKLDENDESDFNKTADVFDIQSIYGRKINSKIAYSIMGELRTTFLENSFNPAYLDLGIGITWTPIKEFIAVLHPLNSNIIISDDDLSFQSSLGFKTIADYNRNLSNNVSFRSRLSSFLSYENFDRLSNVTWINGLKFKIIKNIGIGIEYAMRRSKQETELLDSDYQSYFILGISYNL